MSGAIFPLADELSPDLLERAVDAFFKDLLDDDAGYGPLHAAFDALHVTESAGRDVPICDDVHDSARDPEMAAVIAAAAAALRPVVRIILANTIRTHAYVVPAEEHLLAEDLAAFLACMRRPAVRHLTVAEYRRIFYHLAICAACDRRATHSETGS